MEQPLKTPEQLLAYKPLAQILAAKDSGVHAVAPDTTVFAALRLMADKGIGFLVVLDGQQLAGVFSERDYARKVVLQAKESANTPVRDVMTREVVSVTPGHTVPQCMALMNQHSFRHLPVVDAGKVVGVISIRDLLREIVEHHERLIRHLEVERMTILDPSGSSY